MNYEQLKNSILQEAIEGRLVKQDPNDEPAAVLLDRIADEKRRLIKEKKIKRDKNGGVEIKLCDRQKAMEQMLTYASRTETQSQADALLTALTGGTAHADSV